MFDNFWYADKILKQNYSFQCNPMDYTKHLFLGECVYNHILTIQQARIWGLSKKQQGWRVDSAVGKNSLAEEKMVFFCATPKLVFCFFVYIFGGENF